MTTQAKGKPECACPHGNCWKCRENAKWEKAKMADNGKPSRKSLEKVNAVIEDYVGNYKPIRVTGPFGQLITKLALLLDAEREAERERIASMVERMSPYTEDDGDYQEDVFKVARLIRANTRGR